MPITVRSRSIGFGGAACAPCAPGAGVVAAGGDDERDDQQEPPEHEVEDRVDRVLGRGREADEPLSEKTISSPSVMLVIIAPSR
jgi:hypothetical protein